ncbi:hypothetical protein NQZ79_g3327 [Umbelopsis isabellina]|nr:hypothetical protein NQZ79_g3327 [Umbelopsis isabellina]
MKLDRQTDFPAHQKVKLHVEPQNLQGKTIVITGGNSGLGLASAKSIAKMNPSKLILACRNTDTAAEAVEAIKADGFDAVEVWPLDQSSYTNVKAFAKKYNESGLDLHVLLANAGVLPRKPAATPGLNKDGNEEILATNHMGAALLALELLPSIRRTAAKANDNQLPRIIIVASDVHYWAEFPAAKEDGNIIKTMNSEKTWTNVLDRYMDSKLLNVFFANELANKLKQSNVPEDKKIVVASCNPGLCMSPEDAANPNHPIPAPLREISRDYTEGCKTHVFTSIDPSVNKPGQFVFYSNCAPLETADITLGKDGDVLRERVWRDTFEVLGVTEQEYQI